MKFQFLFSQFWYPLFSAFMALMFMLPIIALVAGRGFRCSYLSGLSGAFCAAGVIRYPAGYRWRASGTFRPFDAKILSFEATLFLFARWPWALAGTLAALRDWATGSFVDFRVTPKGASEVDPLPLRVLAPLRRDGNSLYYAGPANPGCERKQPGLYIFAIMKCAGLCRSAARHYRPACPREHRALSHAVLSAGSGRQPSRAHGPAGCRDGRKGRDGIAALSWGTRSFSLFDDRFSVAGAGIGGRDIHKVIFNPHCASARPAILIRNRGS